MWILQKSKLEVHLCTLRLHPTRNIYRSTTQAHHSRRQAEIIEFQGHHISFPFDPFLQTPDAQVLALGELAYIDTCSSYVWEKQVFIHGSVWSTRVHCPPQREVHCLAMQREKRQMNKAISSNILIILF